MIAAATLRRRIAAGDTFAILAAELGISPSAMQKRAARLGVRSSDVLGRRRCRPLRSDARQEEWHQERREYARARRAVSVSSTSRPN